MFLSEVVWRGASRFWLVGVIRTARSFYSSLSWGFLKKSTVWRVATQILSSRAMISIICFPFPLLIFLTSCVSHPHYNHYSINALNVSSWNNMA